MLIQVSDTLAGSPLAIRLSRDVVLVAWQAAQWDGAFRPVLMGRHAAKPPLVAARLPDSEWRVGLCRLPPRTVSGAALRLSIEAGAPAFRLPSSEGDAAALVLDLPCAARARLLRLLLEAGTGLFALAAEPGFLALATALARREAGVQQGARSVAAGPGQWRLMRGAAVEVGGQAYLIGPTRCLRIHASSGSALHALIEAPHPDEVLCGGAAQPWAQAVMPPEADPMPLLDRLAAAGSDASSLARLIAVVLGPRSAEPPIRDTLQAAALLAPARPRSRADVGRAVTGALEVALPDPAGGLFLRGWLRDPHGLLRGVALAMPDGERMLSPDALHRFPRRDLAPRFRRAAHAPGEPGDGFVAYIPAAAGAGPQPDLLLKLAGGGSVALTPVMRTLPPAAARDVVLASVRTSALTETMLDACIAPAAQHLHQAVLALPRTPVVHRIGVPNAKPEVSVVIPIYRNLAFLRAQFAGFAADPGWSTVETIFVLDSPEQAAEVEHLLRGLHMMHGLPVTLAVPPRNLGYAAASNLGADLARAPMLLLLNSDVVPDRPGWLKPLVAAAGSRRAGVAGPKLLFDDGSIQHAGMHFARDAEGAWYNRHYHKGFPRGYAPANSPREVPAVTGAALMVTRRLFQSVGGLTEDYVVGDYEDSDLCLKLRRAGARVMYSPASELWHFERRSMALNESYTGTLAARLNRRRHASRWSETMDKLMVQFAPAGAP